MLFGVRIEELCKRSSTSYQSTSSFAELSHAGNAERTLLVCDLVTVKSELGEITRLAKERNWKVFGYYPHVDKDTETLARKLGVEFVTPRSATQPKLKLLLS